MFLAKIVQAIEDWFANRIQQAESTREEASTKFAHGPTTICRCCYEPEAPGPGEVCAACLRVRTMNESEIRSALEQYEREIRDYLTSLGEAHDSRQESGT